MNKPLLKQALDALLASRCYVDVEGSDAELDVHLSAVAALQAELAKPDPEPVGWFRKDHLAQVQRGAFMVGAHKQKDYDYLVPLYAAPKEPNCRFPIRPGQDELERLYKNALKREFDLSQALEAALDNNVDKLMAMSDEQVKALAGFEGHHPDDLAALARQTFEIALLKDKQRNCNRHPDAPHGFDRNGSHAAGRHVCTCENWAPGEAS